MVHLLTMLMIEIAKILLTVLKSLLLTMLMIEIAKILLTVLKSLFKKGTERYYKYIPCQN